MRRISVSPAYYIFCCMLWLWGVLCVPCVACVSCVPLGASSDGNVAGSTWGLKWGFKAHQIIGHMTWELLTPPARAHLTQLLGSKAGFIEAMIYADKLRSNRAYAHTKAWHYATVPTGKQYEAHGKRPDVVHMLSTLYQGLRTGKYYQDEVFDLKMLVHLVGDIHQPLHVGNGTDRGGNQVHVQFFGENMNLHKLWDREILDTCTSGISRANMAAKLLAESSMPANELHVDFVRWANENLGLRDALYADLPKDSASSVRYYHRYSPIIQQRLYVASRRLAYMLNGLYGHG